MASKYLWYSQLFVLTLYWWRTPFLVRWWVKNIVFDHSKLCFDRAQSYGSTDLIQVMTLVAWNLLRGDSTNGIFFPATRKYIMRRFLLLFSSFPSWVITWASSPQWIGLGLQPLLHSIISCQTWVPQYDWREEKVQTNPFHPHFLSLSLYRLSHKGSSVSGDCVPVSGRVGGATRFFASQPALSIKAFESALSATQTWPIADHQSEGRPLS